MKEKETSDNNSSNSDIFIIIEDIQKILQQD